MTTFVTSFTLPYLLNPPYAALGGKVGYIYGSICFVCVVLTFLYIPELKGRSLEEVDELFAMGIPLRKFKGVKTSAVEDQVDDKIAAAEHRDKEFGRVSEDRS